MIRPGSPPADYGARGLAPRAGRGEGRGGWRGQMEERGEEEGDGGQ